MFMLPFSSAQRDLVLMAEIRFRLLFYLVFDAAIENDGSSVIQVSNRNVQCEI